MKTILFTAVFCFSLLSFAQAQFAPQTGLPGSTAIHKSSPSIKGWATECAIRRGFQDIAIPSLGYAGVGDSTAALGIADGEVVSLGDSGIATIRFAQALYNGTGADFAVFENGFQNPVNPEEAYLELAFVEVSSDGEHFFRFPATSNTPLTSQVKGVGDYMNARLVNNLAGKYTAQNGTPFDLEELKGISGLDINHITHVRIIDVVGSVGAHHSTDHSGQLINDPYPTPFLSGGFDLDAVAAINIIGSGIPELQASGVKIFPNPSSGLLFVELDQDMADAAEILISDVSGKIILQQKAMKKNELSLAAFSPGLYLIGIRHLTGIQWIGKCSKI